MNETTVPQRKVKRICLPEGADSERYTVHCFAIDDQAYERYAALVDEGVLPDCQRHEGAVRFLSWCDGERWFFMHPSIEARSAAATGRRAAMTPENSDSQGADGPSFRLDESTEECT